jgi:hypothetical protein
MVAVNVQHHISHKTQDFQFNLYNNNKKNTKRLENTKNVVNDSDTYMTQVFVPLLATR